MVNLNDIQDPEIRERARRVIATQEDPAFQENARRLAAEIRDAEEVSAGFSKRHRLIRCGIPEEHWRFLEAPKPGPAIDAVRKFLDGPEELRFLVLAGPAGRGKSFALSWAVYEQGGEFMNAHELANASSFDGAFYDRLESARVFALDELGTEKSHDAYESRLFGVLNNRYQRLRKTVIATNLTPDAFRAHYLGGGLERLVDRLRTAAEWVNLPGESMRTHWADGREQ